MGGGPGGMYLAILLKARNPKHRVTIYERERPHETFGFGVVFSDATMGNLELADAESYHRITERFFHWDDIHIHLRGQILRSTGHGFAGLSRQGLLDILADRCRSLGVKLTYQDEVQSTDRFGSADLIVIADGLNSRSRDERRERFGTSIDLRPNRFVWLGTTRPFSAFSFFFEENEHGLWRAHAYQYENGHSTFIVEATEETFVSSGLSEADEEATVAYCERVFAEALQGHPLLRNKSVWRRFPTVRNERWYDGNRVLLGDAVHTAHFSVGSGTKLALEDAIALADALDGHEALEDVLQAYQEERKPAAASLQRAAQASLEWFENTERYLDTEPIQFGFSLLTRSLRITHEELKVRDPEYVKSVDRWFARSAAVQAGVDPAVSATAPPPPPLFTPFRLRDLLLENRVVVSAMCQYSAEDGRPDDWHLVHLGSRAVGGAGLVMTEMTDVSADGRITYGCAGMYDPRHIGDWKRIVDFVHRHTRAKIGMQLAHAGRKGATKLSWEGGDEPLPEGEWPLFAPSPLPYLPYGQVPRPMTRADMDRVTEDFVRSAQWAQEAGFDLLEIHLAHGYLLSTFISPLTNRRTDEYGGSLENRMRFPLEIFDAVRSVWPDRKPISVRISATDWAPGGVAPEDSVEVAELLKAHGCDLVDVSAGQVVSDAKPIYGRLFQTPFADRIRHDVGIPTMAVGAISSYSDVNTILAAGRADLCAIARMHLWDPYWTRHAAFELGYPLPWPDPYHVLDRYRPRWQ
ncbi:MAG: bifunctional salicylyl-CoA 5-hydroxylase/oxidoreductase [Candidatus Eisenbacteria bacterium]|uniref:Bifunctional salicylyl-CoA 5-hydroxylase/oxidoreductase n=1 Tax=Eiseniibacteriota bacterium TaxID=2212470 RepID=A0A956LYW1_UNCEI|nr:bifunctional salicylyl-CoA 5-hydroxylase/oxidoreductase [Candidatus Eisenbacteria bacterium]